MSASRSPAPARAARKTAAPPPRPRGRRPGSALYKEIAEQIAGGIEAGTFPVGSLLPTEAAFSAQLDVGRHTVREALRVLSQSGLIVRRAGTGSTVVSNGRRSVFAHSVTDFDQWFNYPASVRRERIGQGQVVADATLAEQLGCAVGTPWFRVSALRTLEAASAPLCWVDIFIQPRFARVMKSRQVDTKPIHEQIEAMFDVSIARVEVRISAGRVPMHMAEALSVDADSPALLLRRRYLAANGELLQASRTVHPENRYVYEMTFQRAAANRYR